MIFYLVDLFYEKSSDLESATIVLLGRLDHKRILVYVHEFYPYFYITRRNMQHSIDAVKIELEQYPQLTKWLIDTKQETKKQYFRGKTLHVIKCTGKQPWLVPEVRLELKDWEVLEADIPFTHRFLIDNNIRCGQLIEINNQKILTQNVKEIHVQCTLKDLNPLRYEQQHQPLLVAAFDIETGNDSNISIQQLLEDKESRIIAWSFAWIWTNESLNKIQSITELIEVDNDRAEKELLQKFQEVLTNLDPDILISYNGNGFDFPYLLAREKKYNLQLKLPPNQEIYISSNDNKVRARGKAIIDLFVNTRGIHTLSGRKRLKDIAEYFFSDFPEKILKLEIPDLPGTLLSAGKRKLVEEYVKQDSRLTLELFFNGLGSDDLAIVAVNGYSYSEALLATARVNGEFELMRILHELQIIIPKKPDTKQIQKNKENRKTHPHEGGQVISPKGLIFDSVLIADFKSMYPTLMTAINIGSESFIRHKEFASEPKTALAVLQERVISRRFAIKDQLKKGGLTGSLQKNYQAQQKALKLVGNSLYGATLYVQGRFFDIEVCNSITKLAHDLMNDLFELTHEWGIENQTSVEYANVIYSDTDSIFIQVKPSGLSIDNDLKTIDLQQLETISSKLLEDLNAQIPSGMELSLEDIAKRIIFQQMPNRNNEIRRKAYAYFSLFSNKVIIKGFEAIRNDLSIIAKDAQESLFSILLTEKDPGEAAINYLQYLIKKIYKMEEGELLKLTLYSGVIKRSPNKYKTRNPSLGAFINFCFLKKLDPEIVWRDYARFPYLITKQASTRQTNPLFNRARHPDIVKKYRLKIDREFYINNIIKIFKKFGIDPRHKKSQKLQKWLQIS